MWEPPTTKSTNQPAIIWREKPPTTILADILCGSHPLPSPPTNQPAFIWHEKPPTMIVRGGHQLRYRPTGYYFAWEATHYDFLCMIFLEARNIVINT